MIVAGEQLGHRFQVVNWDNAHVEVASVSVVYL